MEPQIGFLTPLCVFVYLGFGRGPRCSVDGMGWGWMWEIGGLGVLFSFVVDNGKIEKVCSYWNLGDLVLQQAMIII
ncbi:hypothetical protein F5Y11DRAFT_325368 [Daldinia sp. FL1419]|nr:hypothetical protein F5Y11DRAFT_325368 [Daldinia sp. FL1419]